MATQTAPVRGRRAPGAADPDTACAVCEAGKFMDGVERVGIVAGAPPPPRPSQQPAALPGARGASAVASSCGNCSLPGGPGSYYAFGLIRPRNICSDRKSLTVQNCQGQIVSNAPRAQVYWNSGSRVDADGVYHAGGVANGRCAARGVPVVGRGHASLSADLDTAHQQL
jgi:hypothetical protein